MKLLTGKPGFVSSLIICYILMAICSLENGAEMNGKVPAVIVFGDSIVDPGNNNNIRTFIKCNFPPYGRDFIRGKATGRFSNGKVPSDFIASMLGVKELLPAYLDPNLQLQDMVTGVSFASGGSGYDPMTSKLVSVLSLSDQLNMFKGYLMKVKSGVGVERATSLVSESIYVVCIGSDDIANTYFSTPIRRSRYDINSYTDLMVSSASHFLEELYRLGAKKIAVLSLPPVGCLPSQRTVGGGLERGCSEPANQAATLFNSKLSSSIDSQNERHPDATLVYFDIYNPLISLIQHPAQYGIGFKEATQGCCGTGEMEVSVLCAPWDERGICSDASKYVFWDSYHPTEKAYRILTMLAFSKNVNKLL